MSPCSTAGSWPRKELDLECKLELAFHTDFYAKSHGVQSSHCSSIWVNQETSLLPHIGTVIRSPIGHVSYGLFRPLVMVAQYVLMFHAGTRVLSDLNLTRVPQWYLGSGMEVIRGSTCTLVERITDYESQST